MLKKQTQLLFLLLSITLLLCFVMNIALGQVKIPITEVIHSLFGDTSTKDSWKYIVLNYRLPKSITAMLVGIGLSICGLLMQTLFRNPLAGPYVLGLSSGSSLGVAFLILGANLFPPLLTSFLTNSFSIIIASCLGSFLVLMLILYVSYRLRDTMSILIVGLMFSSFTSAVVSVLTYFSTAEQLQKFTFWSMGSIGNINGNSLVLLSITVFIGLLLAVFVLKPLDSLLLGENYAKSMGMNLKKTRQIIIISSSILAGSITAFAGPIAFIGLAVPHLSKLLFTTSNHKILFASTLFLGAIIMLLCDTISQLPGFDFTLPINAITSIVGAPVVIWLVVHKNKIY